jgi:tRNA(Ile)-lysidine synthase
LAKSKKLTDNQEILINAIRQSYQQSLAGYKPKIINIALSGGCDSMVLLHALNELKDELNFTIKAIHINHDISSNADKWQSFCGSECQKVKVNFDAKKINIKPEKHLGVEGAARKLRYEALDELRDGMLATAHHQNDQAETLFLQLIRGSGLKGLASMPHYHEERNTWKPLLNVNREIIKKYAKSNNVLFIEDESNLDIHYDRNFLRHEVFPVLSERFPHLVKTLARSVEHIAEGLNLTETIAKEDAKSFFSADLSRLSLMMIKELPRDRIINLIRWWLNKNNILMPSKKTIDSLYEQIIKIKKDNSLLIKISEKINVRAFQDELWLVKSEPYIESYEIIWRGEDKIILPDQSQLIFRSVRGAGFSLEKLGVKALRIQNRIGGEKFKPSLNQPSRTLKYLLQKSKIPPWQREKIPLIFSEDTLVAVPNFGVHHEFVADKEKNGLIIEWVNYEPQI